MQRKLTDEQEAKVSMYMRVIAFTQKHYDELKSNKEIMDHYETLTKNVALILEELSEEERDIVLERYKDELSFINERK